MARLSEQPAHDSRAEQAIIGAILHNPSVFVELSDLKASHFYKPPHPLLYSTLRQMYEAGEDVDSVTLFARLRESRDLQKIGGAPYLSDLLQAFKSASNVGGYAKIVIDQWKLRQLKALSERFGRLHDTVSVDDIPEALGAAQKFLDECDVDTGGDDGFDSAYDSFTEWYESDTTSIPTPWGGLNRTLSGGFHRQRCYLFAGRPGTGKSILGLNSALWAAKSGFKAVVYSMEMPKEECLARVLACGASVPMKHIFEHRLSDEDQRKIKEFTGQDFRRNLQINDKPSQTIESIAADCRSKRPDLVVIDHSLLLDFTDRRHSTHQQVNHMAKTAKLLSRRQDCAVVILHQMNRAREKENRKPLLSDLREGGEADADVVVALDPDPDNHQVVAHTLKNRLGPTGIPTSFVDEFAFGRLG